ncbi:MAG: hypothetical protein KF712_13150 [Akkermansiaceae bacterium]|nr:hypothetical protein [Akkermansiaceae bacterium]
MKTSLILVALIIASACGLWVLQSRSISELKQRERVVAERLRASGLSLEESNINVDSHSSRARLRREDEAVAMGDVEKLIQAFQNGTGPTEDPGKLLEAMDGDRAEILIRKLADDASPKSENLKALFAMAMMKLVKSRPEAALAHLSTMEAFFTDPHERKTMGEEVTGAALGNWARTNPQGAADWLKERSRANGEYVSERIARNLLASAAVKDPALSFDLLGQLGLKDGKAGFAAILGSVRTDGERDVMLAAMRRHLAGLTDPVERAGLERLGLQKFASGIAKDGIDSAIRWVETLKLPEAELVAFSEGLIGKVRTAETGEWIGWVSRTLSQDKIDGTVRAMMAKWTEADPQAAGQWLVSAHAGSGKTSAVRAYAETVAKYDPQAAEQWALTLPDGAVRRETLENILKSLPADGDENKKAAASFAERHGLR